MEATSLASLLGRTPDQVKDSLPQVEGLAGSSNAGASVYDPNVQVYPDATYHTYYQLGISLCYTPSPEDGTTRILSHIDIVNPRREPSFAATGARRGRKKDPLADYTAPNLPLTFRFPDTLVPTEARGSTKGTSSRGQAARDGPAASTTNGSTIEPITRSQRFDVSSSTNGKDFVGHFGEPSKKSEGEAGYVESSLEWDKVNLSQEDGVEIKVGIMIDLREEAAGQNSTGGESGGPGSSIWDRAGGWGWSTLKLFVPESKVAR